MRTIEEIVVAVVDALDAEGIDYLLVGSFSSTYYSNPRSTNDADFVVHLLGKSILRLRSRLPEGFRIDPQIGFETATFTRRNVLRVEGSLFKAELFRLSDDPHDQEWFRRRRRVRLLDREVCLPSPEDVIVTKLRWLRAKDRADILAVMAAQTDTLDWAYVEHWADLHETRAAMDELRGIALGGP